MLGAASTRGRAALRSSVLRAPSPPASAHLTSHALSGCLSCPEFSQPTAAMCERALSRLGRRCTDWSPEATTAASAHVSGPASCRPSRPKNGGARLRRPLPLPAKFRRNLGRRCSQIVSRQIAGWGLRPVSLNPLGHHRLRLSSLGSALYNEHTEAVQCLLKIYGRFPCVVRSQDQPHRTGTCACARCALCLSSCTTRCVICAVSHARSPLVLPSCGPLCLSAVCPPAEAVRAVSLGASWCLPLLTGVFGNLV
jgi:hypothetical protein